MNLKSLLIGGLLPTLLLGLGTVLKKLSMRKGSSVPNYLVQVGGTVLCVGLLATALGGGWVSSPRARGRFVDCAGGCGRGYCQKLTVTVRRLNAWRLL